MNDFDIIKCIKKYQVFSNGQYGPKTDDRPKLIAFLSGYRNTKTGKFFSL